ncbi:MAG: hypothetical protein JNK48_03145 [Bryobacterales bacterium]|nr:hypothetical protein [Bryobacterales bacterium]
MSAELWRQAASRRPDCPSVDDWAAYPDLPAGAPQRRALDQHRASCPACEAEAAMLASFLAAEPQPAEAADLAYIQGKLPTRAPHAAPAPWWKQIFAPSTFRVWAFAAVAFAAVAIGLQYRSGSLPPVTQETGGVMRATLSVEGVAPVGDLPAPPRQFTWQAVSGAASYTLRILAVDGAELYRCEASAQPSCLPTPPQDVFLPLRTVQVRVTAYDSAGKEIAVSPDIPLRVLPQAVR